MILFTLYSPDDLPEYGVCKHSLNSVLNDGKDIENNLVLMR